MKIFAHYDLEGNIQALVVVEAPDQAGLALAPRPGLRVTQVQNIAVKPGEAGLEELQETARSHRVREPNILVEIVRKGD